MFGNFFHPTETMTFSSPKTWQDFKIFYLYCFLPAENTIFFSCSGQEERLWIPLISSYEDTKFGVEGEADVEGEGVSGSPQMRPLEEKEDSSDVEDILEFNGEHVRMSRGSERLPLWVAPSFQSLKVDFSFLKAWVL